MRKVYLQYVVQGVDSERWQVLVMIDVHLFNLHCQMHVPCVLCTCVDEAPNMDLRKPSCKSLLYGRCP